MSSKSRVTVVGGGFAGLSAAYKAQRIFDEVVLVDEGSYEGERRGSWGEMIWDYGLIPLKKDVQGYRRSVEEGIFVSENDETRVEVPNAAIIDRGEFEKYWVSQIDADIKENTYVNKEKFQELAEESDLVIDASGPFPVSRHFIDVDYDVLAPTVSGRIQDDFSELYPEPRAISYKNYFVWIVPQSKNEATVGIGCEIENDPADLYDDLEEILTEYDIDIPPLEELYVGNDVMNGVRNMSNCSYELDGTNVMLVGDSIGIVNRWTGFGLARAARTGELAIKSYANDESYRRNLLFENDWKKFWETASAPLISKVGLKGLSPIVNDGITYRRAFDPDGPTHTLRAAGHEIKKTIKKRV